MLNPRKKMADLSVKEFRQLAQRVIDDDRRLMAMRYQAVLRMQLAMQEEVAQIQAAHNQPMRSTLQ